MRDPARRNAPLLAVWLPAPQPRADAHEAQEGIDAMTLLLHCIATLLAVASVVLLMFALDKPRWVAGWCIIIVACVGVTVGTGGAL